MKRIKFTELGFKKDLDTLIVVIGIVFLIIGMIAGFGYLDNRFMGLAGLSAVFTTFPQLKNLFYNNHFVWNKKGGTLKLNSKSKSITFSEIVSIQKEENKLTILKKDKTQLIFSSNGINSDDIDKLNEILKKHIKN